MRDKRFKIHGVGFDIAEIEHFKNALRRNSIIKDVLTDREINYCKRFSFPAQHIAARFAGKKALMRALGQEGKDLGERSVEILTRPGGAPFVKVEKGRVRAGFKYHITISHSDRKAVAFVIVSDKRE